MKDNSANPKKEFEAPEVEVRRFTVRDIVRTSPLTLPLDPFSEDEEVDF